MARAVQGAPQHAASAEPTQPIRVLPRRATAPHRLGPYRVVERIARGGVGGVFLARDEERDELVAIKTIDPELAVHPDIVARLRDELRIARRVRHQGLIDIFHFDFCPDGVPYLVMELLDGESLGALIERGRLELGAAAAIGAQIAAAASALAAGGVVHCDLKPDNVHILYQAGLAGWPATKVLDFGVARIPGEEIEDEPSIGGTPSYMAPEQWRGEACAASDVYSLGCVLYELVTGAPPFQGTLPELMSAHFEALPLRPAVHRPGLRADLDRLICRMLAKDTRLRPSMIEVGRVLTAIAEQLPSPCEQRESFAALLAVG